MKAIGILGDRLGKRDHGCHDLADQGSVLQDGLGNRQLSGFGDGSSTELDGRYDLDIQENLP